MTLSGSCRDEFAFEFEVVFERKKCDDLTFVTFLSVINVKSSHFTDNIDKIFEM